MIPLRRGAFGAFTVAVLLGAFAAPLVQAQDVPAPVAAPVVQARTFQLRNVKASWVAFWLDPAHHAAPDSIQISRALDDFVELNLEQFAPVTPEKSLKPTDPTQRPKYPRLPGNGNGPRDLQLPSGIASVVANDAGNTLLAQGTADGIVALEKLLPSLDVLPVLYEVEAQFYRLDLATLPQTGLKFQTLPPDDNYNFGSIAPLPLDFEQRMRTLIASKHALLLTDPHVTVFDGLAGQLRQSTSTPVIWSDTPTLPRPANVPSKGQTPQRVAFVTSSTGMNTKVTRIGNGLIVLAIEPRLGARSFQVQGIVPEEKPFAIQFSSSTAKQQIIVVVTPRRVRRAGDDT